jgi:DNA-binding NarL/FixJ family response regulator
VTSDPISCLVADDQAMVREGFGAILAAQSDLTVVGQAADGADAVRLAEELQPDVILMDVRMPVMDGLEATRRILEHASDDAPRVLMLTTFDLDEYVYDALRSGASGFLLKDAPADELVHAVRVVAAGDALVSPSVMRRLIADFVAQQPQPVRAEPVALDVLTPREREVLGLVARGLSNAEISTMLVVAPQTTKTHVGRILRKLNLRDRAQAVVAAYESGLIVPGESPGS